MRDVWKHKGSERERCTLLERKRHPEGRGREYEREGKTGERVRGGNWNVSGSRRGKNGSIKSISTPVESQRDIFRRMLQLHFSPVIVT